MNTSLECIPCIVNSFTNLLKNELFADAEKEKVMRKLLEYLSETDYKQSPPVLGKEMHRMIREMINNPDPYKEVKDKFNNLMMDRFSEFEKIVSNSQDPFDTAMRLAIAGNVIDFGPQNRLDINETINKVINSKLAIDDSLELKKELKDTNSLIYIGDNCGEIVLDKLFLKTIDLPNMYYVVRGSPVLNDATLEDAKLVGIDKIAKVITTGDNAPGAVWDLTSEEFKKVFYDADVIISKGQGNLEGILGVNKTIFFLLVTKCDLISKLIDTKTGEFVVRRISAVDE